MKDDLLACLFGCRSPTSTQIGEIAELHAREVQCPR
jgi:hypothetical protein